VLDWQKRQQARASVGVAVEEELDRLPAAYTDTLYWHKCDLVYQHGYNHYFGQGRSVYAEAS
jgi:type I restriction enzyme R subunit